MRSPTWALAVAATACIRQPVTVHPAEIHHNIVELRRTGHARVGVSPSGRFDLHVDQRVEAELETTAGKSARSTLSIGQLIAHCPDIVPFAEDRHRRDPPCLLQATRSKALVLDSRLRPDPAPWSVALSTTGLLGLGACAYLCDEPWNIGSAVVVGSLVVAMLLYLPRL